MTSPLEWITLFAVAGVIAMIQESAATRGPKRLLLVTILCAGVLLAAGLIGHARFPSSFQAPKESYVLLALMPSPLTAYVLISLRRAGVRQVNRILVGALAWIAVALASIAAGDVIVAATLRI